MNDNQKTSFVTRVNETLRTASFAVCLVIGGLSITIIMIMIFTREGGQGCMASLCFLFHLFFSL
jgi:hypothetical protein